MPNVSNCIYLTNKVFKTEFKTFKFSIMKKKILLILATSLFSFLFIFSSSTIKKDKNIDFVQNAEASVICEEYMGGVIVCCISGGEGCLIFNEQEMDGPHYDYGS